MSSLENNRNPKGRGPISARPALLRTHRTSGTFSPWLLSLPAIGLSRGWPIFEMGSRSFELENQHFENLNILSDLSHGRGISQTKWNAGRDRL